MRSNPASKQRVNKMTKYHGRNDDVTMPKKGEREKILKITSPFLASSSGATMFFLCITAEATTGPYADRRLLPSLYQECCERADANNCALNMPKESKDKEKKNEQQQHILFHLSCFFMYKVAQINVLYTGRKKAHFITAVTCMALAKGENRGSDNRGHQHPCWLQYCNNQDITPFA